MLSSVNEEHHNDIAIQYYVLKNLNIKVCEATIAHINTDFIYEWQNNDYKDLIIEVEVLEDIQPKTHWLQNGLKIYYQ